MKSMAATDEQLEGFHRYEVDPSALLNPEVRTYKEGEFLFHDGKKANFLFFLLEGEVLTYLQGPKNSKMPLGTYLSEGILDASSLFQNDEIYHYEAVAQSEVKCLSVPLEKNRNALLQQPSFIQKCAYQFSDSLDVTRNYFFVKKYPFEKKLCSYIAFTRTQSIWVCNQELTARDLHTNVRHIERTLESLCARGILQKEGEGYSVKNRERFEKMNDGSFYAKRNKYGEIIRNIKKQEA